MKKIITLSIIFLPLFGAGLKAQNIEAGFELGYGRTGNQNSHPYSNFLNIFDNAHPFFLREGLVCYYTPDSAIFSIKTGILYCKKGIEELDKDVSMIDLPIGCDIRFGKKCSLLLGLGFDINYLYPRKSSNTTFPLFQIGVNANTGVGFVINRRWCLDVKYQVGYDISNLCSTEYQSFGYSYNETYLSINGFISVSLRYKFLKN